MTKKLFIAIITLAIIVMLSILAYYTYTKLNTPKNQFSVVKITHPNNEFVISKIQAMGRIGNVRSNFQNEKFDVNLEKEDYCVFGVCVDKKGWKTTRLISGYIPTFVDVSKISKDDIIINWDNKEITINNVELSQDTAVITSTEDYKAESLNALRIYTEGLRFYTDKEKNDFDDKIKEETDKYISTLLEKNLKVTNEIQDKTVKDIQNTQFGWEKVNINFKK